MMIRGRLLTAAFLLVGCGGTDGDPPTPSAKSLDDCFSSVQSPRNGFIEIQDYATADGKYRVRRARQPGSRSSVGETIPYDMIRFGMESGGDRECIEDRARLSYTFEHHNWDDTMEARGTAARYRVNERFEPVLVASRWHYTLHVLAPDGSVREGPLALVEAGCRTLPYNLNGCPSRQRTDAP